VGFSAEYAYNQYWFFLTLGMVSIPTGIFVGSVGLVFSMPLGTGFIRDKNDKIISVRKYYRIRRQITKQKKAIHF